MYQVTITLLDDSTVETKIEDNQIGIYMFLNYSSNGLRVYKKLSWRKLHA